MKKELKNNLKAWKDPFIIIFFGLVIFVWVIGMVALQISYQCSLDPKERIPSFTMNETVCTMPEWVPYVWIGFATLFSIFWQLVWRSNKNKLGGIV